MSVWNQLETWSMLEHRARHISRSLAETIITARVCPGMNLHIWCVVVTNLSVCLFVCQQVACDVVTVYSRSESPCHVSLSQSKSVSIVRTTSHLNSPRLHRSVPLISVSVGACTKNITRPRALTSVVKSSILPLSLSLFLFLSFSTSQSHDLSHASIPSTVIKIANILVLLKITPREKIIVFIPRKIARFVLPIADACMRNV